MSIINNFYWIQICWKQFSLSASMARVQTAKGTSHGPLKQSVKYPKKDSKPKKSGEKEEAKSNKSKGKSLARPDKRNDSLRDEIIALGGDEEDYELLKDFDSDEDVIATGSNKKDATLSKDVGKLMKELNFSSVRPKDIEEETDVEKGEEEEEEDEEKSEVEDESEGESSDAASSEVNEQKDPKKEEKQNITVPKVGPNARLVLEPSPQWYTLLSPLPPSKASLGSPSPHTLSQKQAHASSLHASELAAYENVTSASKLTASSSDAAFLQKILSSGTLSDRLSALTLLAQSSPLHNMRALETLRTMANKKGREESLKALRAICDWWVGGGAPDRKLKYFVDQPLNHPGVTDKYLLLWYFEDWLKKYFYTILQTLETLSLDPLPYVRLQAMALIFTLLRDKPEQEQNLLRLLVNKLGDSERSVASRASYHLLQLLQAHPSMKAVVLREITSLVFKPARGSTAAATSGSKTASGATHLKFATSPVNSAPKAKGNLQDKDDKKDLQQEHSRYYASITLNQIMLSTTEADRGIARQLISLYFELFKEMLGNPGRPVDGSEKGDGTGSVVDHSRYAKEKRKEQAERKGKGKEQDDHEGFAEVEDSNSRLISAILTGVNRALPFAKLSLDNVEFSKHIDTLFLISHKSTFNISLQALRLIMLICQSLKSTPSTSTSFSALSMSISDRYYRALYASLLDIRLNSSNKHAMYLNLLLKSLKVDTKPERVKAFVRRFVQLLVGAGNGGAEFVAGGLYLLGELFKAQPTLSDLLGKPREASGEGEPREYDSRKRDPQYADAGASPMWELTPLLSYYHPTIRLHAFQLLSGAEPTANADLSLNTLSHFLDRFVYRNPKKPRPKGPSAMQPSAAASAQDGMSIRIVKGATTDAAVINDERFWKKDIRNVPVDQVFFHKYFSKKNEKEHARVEKLSKRKGGEDSEDEDEDEADGVTEKADDARSEQGSGEDEKDDDESEGEAEIWEAIKATNPDLNPDLDDEEDNLPSDDSEDSEVDENGDVSASEGEDDEEEQEYLDADEKTHEGEVEEDEDEESDEALSLAEASDAEDLISLNDIELPEGLIAYHSSSDPEASHSSSEAETEWEGFSDSDPDNAVGRKPKVVSNKKRKREKGSGRAKGEENKNKRRKLRSLPTFATYEDYAKLIEGEPEDNI
ncbi:CBF-domain-containing protein [Sanghuangporus baumii]|uniref:CBF-domain-containing protein n=1 Tax=Sanghuangporus baumii TaxID=108892 RepID=A0A9Q5HVK9_SANBA|nr:CBF-domain-containing protein [Sanghuangporus baumii]